MENEQLEEIKVYFESLKVIQYVFNESNQTLIESRLVDDLEANLNDINKLSPGLLKEFIKSDYHLRERPDGRYYDRKRLKIFIGEALAKLESTIFKMYSPGSS